MPLEQKFTSYKREYFLQVANPNISHIFWEVYKIIYCLPFPLLYNVETTVTLFFSHFLGWRATTSKFCTGNNRRVRNSTCSTNQNSAVVRKDICWGWLASSESLWPHSAGHHRSPMAGLGIALLCYGTLACRLRAVFEGQNRGKRHKSPVLSAIWSHLQENKVRKWI